MQQTARTAMPSFDQTPDKPRPFGYKVSWFAVKTADPAAVLAALEIGEAVPANWASGIEPAYSNRDPHTRHTSRFVSAPINGWVLGVSSWLPYPVAEEAQMEPPHDEIGRKFDVLFSRLMSRFGDVQFFGSHRGVGFVTWTRAVDGKPVRIFGFADE